MDDYEKALSILQSNTDKNFVRRVLNPEAYPELDLGKNNYATHKMAWGEADGKYVVFPTVQYSNNQLKDYGDKAFERAMKKGDYIKFDDPKEAEWFSKNYKSVWKNKDSRSGLIHQQEQE